MKHRFRARLVVTDILKYSILVVASVIALFPLYWIVMTSLKLPADSLSMPPRWIFEPTLRNFRIIFLEDPYPRFLLNSLIIVTSSVLLVVLIGSLAGYVLARFRIPHKESFFFFILTTRMGPPVAFAVPFYIIMAGLRLIDSYLAMVLIYILYNLAFVIWMTRGFFQEVPLDVEEAATLDGCSRLETFLRIALPLATPGIIATAVFCFIVTWNEFFYAMVLTSDAAKTFTVHMPSFVGAPRMRWSEMSAASVVAIIPAIAFAIAVRKYLVRAFTLGTVR